MFVFVGPDFSLVPVFTETTDAECGVMYREVTNYNDNPYTCPHDGVLYHLTFNGDPIRRDMQSDKDVQITVTPRRS